MGFSTYSNQFKILPTAFSEQTTKYNVVYISAYMVLHITLCGWESKGDTNMLCPGKQGYNWYLGNIKCQSATCATLCVDTP